MEFKTKEHLERIYFNQPVWMQNLSFSAYGLYLRRQRHGGYFRKKLEELKESDWWSEDQIRSYQENSLRRVIREACENVPYYRKLFDDHNIVPDDIQTVNDLPKIPLLTKSLAKANQERMVDRRYPKRALRIVRTSGTTGMPLKVCLTSEALQFQWAVRWRHKARFGLRLGDRSLMFGPHLPVSLNQKEPPFWRHNRAINNSYIPLHLLTAKTMPHVVDWLNREKFDYYTGYASAMYFLALFILDRGKRLLNRPKFIVTGAETLMPAYKETIQEVFGVGLTDQYGMAEACGNFSQCEKGKYHLDCEFGISEFLPITGLENTRLRKLVFTGLTNPGMPFIRYDIGDYGILSENPCECGRFSVSMDGIDGRIADYIRTPEGQMIVGMGQVFRWSTGVNQTQIIQNKIDEIDVLVIRADSFNKERDTLIMERELRKRVGTSLKINFRMVESIPLSKNGKFRGTISSLAAASEGEYELQQAISGGLEGLL